VLVKFVATNDFKNDGRYGEGQSILPFQGFLCFFEPSFRNQYKNGKIRFL